MSIAVGRRATLPGTVGVVRCAHQISNNESETVRIQQILSQTVRIDSMACCIKKLDLCIAQHTDKTFVFEDATTVDYGTPSEVAFTIWENATTGAQVLQKTLTGADITQPNAYSFQLDITDVESGAMTATRKFCELAVTLSGGDKLIVGQGQFEVKDTRSFD